LAKVLLDSDVLIEWLRGHEPVVQQIGTLIEEHAELFWTPVSTEILRVFVRMKKKRSQIFLSYLSRCR